MNEAHLHLLLTHIPIVGTLFGLLILAYAVLAKKAEAMMIALGIFVFTGLATVVLYFTGEAAEEVVESLPGISEVFIERHEEAAIFALIAAVLLGVVALGGLILSRRGIPRWFSRTVLALAIVVSGIMAWTANLGGQINHPEIRSGQVTAQTDGDQQSGSYKNDD